MALVINDRVKETSTTTGTGTFNLAGAVTGFDTFVAGIGDTNTTYYAIFEQGTANWEVGVGTVGDATPDTLARTTVITNSLGNTDKISFGGATADVFCTLPASKAVYLDASGNQATGVVGKVEGTNFTDSLLVGHSTTGTLSAAQRNTGIGIDALDALTSGDDNTALGFNALTAQTTQTKNTAVGAYAQSAANNGNNVSVGYTAMKDGTGASNVGIGYAALENVTGNYNIGIGYQSGDNIGSGDGNVVIGKADVSSATGNDQLSISDGEDGSVVWMTGDSDGTVSANGGELTTTGKSFVMGF